MTGPAYTYLTVVGPGPIGWNVARQGPGSGHAQVWTEA